MVALFAFVLALQSTSVRSVAVTIDDLPLAQHGLGPCDLETVDSVTRAVLAPIREMHAPVTAFVIGNNCANLTFEQRRATLRLWQDAGAELGNHTYSHPDLNTMPIAGYEQDILKGDSALRETIGIDRLRWFRSPMLHTGPTPGTKARLAAFLAEHGWRQAAVTFDNSDWMFSVVYRDARERGDTVLAERVRDAYVPYLESVIEFFEKRSVEVVGHEFPQVLLLHANLLNSEKLPEVLRMLKRRGYHFVSLDTAMKDPAYSLPDEYAGNGGFSWIHRWSMTKKMTKKGEPDEPTWLAKQYEAISHPVR